MAVAQEFKKRDPSAGSPGRVWGDSVRQELNEIEAVSEISLTELKRALG